MEPNPPSQTLETPVLQSQSPEDQQQQPLELTKTLPIASISLSLSLSLSSFLSPQLHSSTKKPSLSPFSHLKIPSQISSLSHLSLSSTSPKPSFKASTPSSIANSPLHSPSPLLRRRPADPSHSAGGRRCTVVWFRADLRVHDNEALNAASNDSLSLLPVYLFDPRDYGKSSSGFDKTGPYRATFLLQSVADLRRSLRARGSDLVVRIGRPETVLVEFARAVGADAVYAHREASHDEVRAEERVAKAMEEEGVEVKYFWGSTLYHMDDLPFELEQMPSNYGGFREKVQGVAVRKTIEALDQIKGLPSRGDVDPGEIPSLVDLGLKLAPTMSQDGKPAPNASLVGGETEALERLKKFADECRAQPKRGDSTRDSIYGANFSCKISPWVAIGCLSPRFMYEEMKKTATRVISASSTPKTGAAADNGMNWLMFELLWRDFFRFITKKYSSPTKKIEAEPATACTGALV
ncbi:blue-light photoreceptor PHR2-like [Phoenix dactylifera]|uniref:Blue-light photoreceptor PHR2-like n=1 Tax=Phoenix dactylifera TaxID=42345 RepID=A0A8B8J2F0_PHODC|nr:blue-light photoreceptor PHR2-like [Phoenix dactylifera]